MDEYLNEDALSSVYELLMTQGVDWAINIAAALAIFIVGRWVGKRVVNLVKKGMKRAGTDETLVSFLGNILNALVLAFVIIAALSKLGVETTSLAAIFAAAGLAIGLSLQGSLSNLAAGVMIITFRPFKKGDYVEVAGVEGVVEDVSIFTTTLLTTDNKSVIVPNGSVIGGSITNFTNKEERRVDMVFGIGYGDDIRRAKEVLEDVLASETRVLKTPAPQVAVSELADSSVNFVVRPWVKTADYWNVKFALTEAVKLRFDQEGISIPFPQQDVYMHQVPAAQQAA